jgi:hypothetical protein
MIHPLIKAIENPIKRRERATWSIKQHRENEKRARKVALAAKEGR